MRAIILDTETDSITSTEVRLLIDYNPETGETLWKKDSKHYKRGTTVGVFHNGYLDVILNQKTYKVHRLIFLFMVGRNPTAFVDHINGDTLDNRWANLREATRSENNRNRKTLSSSKTGIKGLSYKGGAHPRYQAHVCIGDKRLTKSISLKGRVEDNVIWELTCWLVKTRKELHGEFANHGESV